MAKQENKTVEYKLLSEKDVVIYTPKEVYDVVTNIGNNAFSKHPEPIWKAVLEKRYKKYPNITPDKDVWKDMMYLQYFILSDDPWIMDIKLDKDEVAKATKTLKNIEGKLKKMNMEAGKSEGVGEK